MDTVTMDYGFVALANVMAKEIMVKEATASSAVSTDIISKEGMDAGSINGGPGFEDGMYTETGMAEVKDPLLSSWPFVIGISGAVLFISIVLGALLAKRKIKKGIELYED